MVYPWMIGSLPHARFETLDPCSIADALSHGSTQIMARDDVASLHRGSTIWLTAADPLNVLAIGWDWVEVRPKVVAMVDPMAIVTNLLCDSPADEESDYLLLGLNEIVHRLPWQEEVCKEIYSWRNDPVSHFRAVMSHTSLPAQQSPLRWPHGFTDLRSRTTAEL